MNDNLSEWLQGLSPQQLELVKNRLDELIAEKKSRIANPGAVSLDDLASSLGLDLRGLYRDVNRKLR